jgi:hypothetical protein
MTRNPPRPVRYLLQACNYAVFMALVWYFSAAPAVRILDDNQAVLTIAFAHAGQLREPCRRLTQEELNALAPNMRALEDCPRERSPVTIEARLDDEVVYSAVLDPPGLFDDGGVDVYYSAKIPAGEHRLELKMNDSVRVDGFNHVFEQAVTIAPSRILLVDFDKETGFALRNFHE